MLRILDHAWHQAHSYRLHELPAEFAYLPVGPRTWEDSLRPKPPNFQGFDYYVLPEEYNLFLSHFDNWCDRTALRATPFRLMNLIGMESPFTPKVTIMHGSPCNEQNRVNLVQMLDDSPGGSPFLVLNSKQAYREFGLGPNRSRAIIHGYDVDEFWSSKERHLCALTVCSAGTMSRTYHGVPLLERIKRDVPAVLWMGKNGDVDYCSSYQEYRDVLAHSLIYLHTGQRSPMPGARTEAMLSGCCIVTTSNHDADECIEHGVTGFLCDTAFEMIDTLQQLLADPRKAYDVGKRGREAAREFFHKQRFIEEWQSLLRFLGVTVD